MDRSRRTATNEEGREAAAAENATTASFPLSPPSTSTAGQPDERLLALETQLVELKEIILKGKNANHAVTPAPAPIIGTRDEPEGGRAGSSGAAALDKLAEAEAARLEKGTPLQLKDFDAPSKSAPCFQDINQAGYSRWDEYDDAWEEEMPVRLLPSGAGVEMVKAEEGKIALVAKPVMQEPWMRNGFILAASRVAEEHVIPAMTERQRSPPLPRSPPAIAGISREVYDLPLGPEECSADELPNLEDFYAEAGKKLPMQIPFQRVARQYRNVTRRIYDGETMTRVLINELLRENRMDPNKGGAARQRTSGKLQALAEVNQQVKISVNAEFQLLVGLGRERRPKRKTALNPWPILADQESPVTKRLRLSLNQHRASTAGDASSGGTQRASTRADGHPTSAQKQGNAIKTDGTKK